MTRTDERTPAGVASHTIAEVLAEFLAEQEQRLAPRTFRSYREVVEFFRHNLNDYAYQALDGHCEAALVRWSMMMPGGPAGCCYAPSEADQGPV